MCVYSTYMWYTYIKQLQIFYLICKMIVYVNNYNIVFIVGISCTY